MKEHYTNKPEVVGNWFAKAVHFLYEADVVGENVILEWHSDLPEESPLKGLLKQLIEWLEESEEDDSEEGDSDQ